MVHGMRRLKRWDNALGAGQRLQGLQRLRVCDGDV